MTYHRYIFIYLFIHFAFTLSGQIKGDYQWPFGFKNKPPEYPNAILDFNGGMVSIIPEYLRMGIDWDRGSICDDRGRLLYYSNGCFIADSTRHQMKNGGEINPGRVHNSQCKGGGYFSRQSDIFLPAPGKPWLYYMLHRNYYIAKVAPWYFIEALRYTLIDARGNNGLGEVIAKNVPILEDTTLAGERMTAVRHANLRDWWIVHAHYGSSKLSVFLLDTSGITETKGYDGTVDGNDGGGWISFSPDGRRLASYTPDGDIELFDFDRSTGYLSNHLHIEVKWDTFIFGSIAFSPNSRYLYLNTILDIYQYDLQAEDIGASRIHIGHWDGWRDERKHPVAFLFMERGPDCRIYIVPASSSRYMSVIMHPDRRGKACDLRQHALAFPTTKPHGLSHFPNYRLGFAPVCDSTILFPLNAVQDIPEMTALLSPNPMRDYMTIDLGSAAVYPVSICVTDMRGKVWVRTVTRSAETTIDTGRLPPGMYFVRLSTGDGKTSVRRVIKM